MNKPYISIVSLWLICGLAAILYTDNLFTQLLGWISVGIGVLYYITGVIPISFATVEYLKTMLAYLKVLCNDVYKLVASIPNEIKERIKK